EGLFVSSHQQGRVLMFRGTRWLSRPNSRHRLHGRTRLTIEALEHRLVLDRTVLVTEHVDIDIGYKGGKFDLGVHDETNDVHYAPDEALLFAGANTRMTQPAGQVWEFLGAGAGNPIWVLPQNQLPDRLLLGVGTEDIKQGALWSYFETDPRVMARGE